MQARLEDAHEPRSVVGGTRKLVELNLDTGAQAGFVEEHALQVGQAPARAATDAFVEATVRVEDVGDICFITKLRSRRWKWWLGRWRGWWRMGRA